MALLAYNDSNRWDKHCAQVHGGSNTSADRHIELTISHRLYTIVTELIGQASLLHVTTCTLSYHWLKNDRSPGSKRHKGPSVVSRHYYQLISRQRKHCNIIILIMHSFSRSPLHINRYQFFNKRRCWRDLINTLFTVTITAAKLRLLASGMPIQK